MKFFGSKEIIGIKEGDQDGFKEVEFKGGSKAFLTDRQLGALVTEQPVDPSVMQSKELAEMSADIVKAFQEDWKNLLTEEGQRKVVKQILVTLHRDWNARIEDIGPLTRGIQEMFLKGIVQGILQTVIDSVQLSFDDAAEYVFGVDKLARRMHDVHRILIHNPKYIDGDKKGLDNSPSIDGEKSLVQAKDL